MKRSSALWLTLILVVTLGRIAMTWRIFSVTYDEPVHVASGYDYLKHHTFLDMQNPPLAQVLRSVAAPRLPYSKRRGPKADALGYRDTAAPRLGRLPRVLRTEDSGLVRRYRIGVKGRARRHGRNTHATLESVRDAVPSEENTRPPLGSRIAARFGEIGLETDIPELRGHPAEPADFEL